MENTFLNDLKIAILHEAGKKISYKKHFRVLDVSINIPIDYKIVNRGCVNNISEDFYKFLRKINQTECEKKAEQDQILDSLSKNRAGGYAAFLSTKNRYGQKRYLIYTSFKSSNNPVYDLFIQAHEESHLIDWIGKRNKLAEIIGINPHFLKRETFANIGGFYGAGKRGFDLEKIRGWMYKGKGKVSDPDCFEEAYKIYTNERK